MKARFSKIELKELTISIGVMTLAIAWHKEFATTLIMLIPAFIILAPAFALHELGHKFAAQKYGYHAEYRMWKKGLLIALAMAVVTTMFGTKFLFIAPGAVYFGGLHRQHSSISDTGKIGFAGPLVNLGLIAVFGIISIMATSSFVSYIASTGVYVNSFLAVLNLIPFGPLDGKKVLMWNRMFWGVALAIALAGLVWGSSFI